MAYPPILAPAMELIAKQQQIIEALVARVNELSADLGHVPIDIAGLGTIEAPKTVAIPQLPVEEPKEGPTPPPTPPVARKESYTTFIFNDGDGKDYFSEEEFTNFGGSFRIVLGEDGKSGKFYISDNIDDQMLLYGNIENCLNKSCDYGDELPMDLYSCKIVTEQPGEVEMSGNKAIITQRMKIKFVNI